jgi:hypothetical protein
MTGVFIFFSNRGMKSAGVEEMFWNLRGNWGFYGVIGTEGHGFSVPLQ